jgi:ornithine carrier protein
MEPSPISVEAAHAPELPLKGKTALTEALEDVLCGSVCAIVLRQI